jgi:hypothetical protein
VDLVDAQMNDAKVIITGPGQPEKSTTAYTLMMVAALALIVYTLRK